MRTFKALAMLAVLGALVVPVAARADAAIRAVIPFEFTVGGATLPAGTYQIETQHGSQTMFIWNLDQAKRSITIANPASNWARAGKPAELVFNKYGDRYFLSEVWGATSAAGRRLPKTHEEREASLKTRAHTVQVAAR